MEREVIGIDIEVCFIVVDAMRFRGIIYDRILRQLGKISQSIIHDMKDTCEEDPQYY